MDFDDKFDDDPEEDKFNRYYKQNDFEVEEKKLSDDSKNLKKLMREKGEDELSDDEEKEFEGLEDLLEKKNSKIPKLVKKELLILKLVQLPLKSLRQMAQQQIKNHFLKKKSKNKYEIS